MSQTSVTYPVSFNILISCVISLSLKKKQKKKREGGGREEEQRERGGEKIPRMRPGKPHSESERKVNSAAGLIL